jgi:hypothetical protein
MLESLGSSITSKHNIFNPKPFNLAENFLLNLALKLNPKQENPNSDPNPNSLYSISHPIGV